MHNIERNETVFLYNKSMQEAVRKFSTYSEVRNFIEDRLRLSQQNFGLESYHPNNLSMTMEQTSRVFRLYNPVSGHFSPVNVTTNTEVLLFPDWRIYNYTEMVNEIIAYKRGNQITFGKGYTYKGSPFEEPNNQRTWAISYGNGHKINYRTHQARLIFPLKDRTEYTTGESIDIIDEVSEMGVEMFDNVLKNVKRKTRPSRVEKVFDIGSFHWEDSYSNSKSWKNKKRQKQWMRKECRERIRHPEYRYTDILLPDDLCEAMSTF